MYPYIAAQICQNCDSPIVVKQKRDKDNQFCCKECYNQFRRKGKPIKINLIGSHYVSVRRYSYPLVIQKVCIVLMPAQMEQKQLIIN